MSTTWTDRSTERPNWFELDDVIVCGPCRADLLREWSPEAVEAKGGDPNGDEVCRPRDFVNLGRTPWAGNEEPLRYMQCDECGGQWGPDA